MINLREPYETRKAQGAFTAQDMDVVGAAFGLRYVPGGSPDGLVEFYVEDDDFYHYKTSFNHFWLYDLVEVARKALEDWHRNENRI